MLGNNLLIEYDVSDGTQTDISYNILKIMAITVFLKRLSGISVVLHSDGPTYSINMPKLNDFIIEKNPEFMKVLEIIYNQGIEKLYQIRQNEIDEIKDELEDSSDLMQASFDSYEVSKYNDNFNIANDSDGEGL